MTKETILGSSSTTRIGADVVICGSFIVGGTLGFQCDGWLKSLLHLNPVADADPAGGEQVRTQAGTVRERLEERLSGERDQVGAGLAQPRASRQDLTDPELLAYKVVEPDATRRHIAA